MDDWEIKKLSEICKVNYGQSPSLTLSEEGNIPVIGTGNEIRYGKNFIYDGESIILGRKGTIDNPIYVNDKFWAIDTAFYLSNFLEADVKWLYYFLLSRKSCFVSEATGVPSISRSFLNDLEINTPPKKEQTTIAQILSTVDKTIEQTEKLIAKYELIKTGLMQDLLTKGIDEHGNIRSEKTHKFKNSPLGRIPVEWEVVPLVNCAKFLDNLRKPIKETDRQNLQGHYPYYGASGIIDYINDFIFDDELILLGEDGENILSRNLPLAFIAKGKFWVNNHAHVIKPNLDMNLDFLCTFLETIDYSPLNTSTAQPKITQGELEKINIAKPQKNEQNIIMQQFHGLTSLIKEENNSRDKNVLIKSGLMQDLLTGKVKVSQLLSKN